MDIRIEATLVVMEAGSTWPGWMEEALPSHSTRVLVQQTDEPPQAFADRVVSRIEGMVAQGFRLREAVVACNERGDASAFEARRVVARSALSAARTEQPTRILFTASQSSHGGVRRALSELAEQLQVEWETVGAVLSVRFGAPSLKPQAVAARVA